MEGWKGTRAVTELSCHPSGEGCKKWKVGTWKGPGQPLKLSFHPSGDGCRKRKVGRNRAATKASPFIPVVKVVENERLEGTRAATKALLSSQW